MATVQPMAVVCSAKHSLNRSRCKKIVLIALAMWLSASLIVYKNHVSFVMSAYTFVRWQLVQKTNVSSPSQELRFTNQSQLSIFNKKDNISISNFAEHRFGVNITNVSNTTVEVKDKCRFPDIDPFDPVVMSLVKFHPTLSCQDGVPHLVYISENAIRVNHSKTHLVGGKNNTFKECVYSAIAKKPGSDFDTVVLHTSVPFSDSINIKENDENLVVECFGTNKTVLSRSYFSLIRVKKDLEILLEENYKKHIATNAPKEVLNVLMIGIDGNSKQNFERFMPKTRHFLIHKLNAIELYKYNTLEGSTFQTVVPMLTGKHWQELNRNNWTSKQFFDYVNEDFIWSDFRKAGYRTGLLIDEYFISAFHYLKEGWDKPPVDYYVRPTVIKLDSDKLMTGNGGHCIGDIPEITYNHDFWVRMATTFNNSQTKPYFGYSFSARLTHDYHDLASAGDDLYLKFLRELKDKNIINNTVILFFSDHGERFGPVRSTYNGFVESRTPYIFWVFPQWFHRKYPEIIKVLKINQERLTTNTDIYETLKDLVNFQATTGQGDINNRGISLFKEIPRDRTCDHAGITLEYCVCNQITNANVSTAESAALANTVINKINRMTDPVRTKCEELTLKSVTSVIKVDSDQHGNNANKNEKQIYQISLTTKPGDALYEAKVAFLIKTKTLEILGDVTRLNMYRGQAECVDDRKLREFCYCKH